jgi:hypothetical protein
LYLIEGFFKLKSKPSTTRIAYKKGLKSKSKSKPFFGFYPGNLENLGNPDSDKKGPCFQMKLVQEGGNPQTL